MKVRLYRGPMNGKVVNVPPGQDRIVIANTKRGCLATFDERMSPVSPITYEQETYSMRMMGVTINGRTYTAPAMHPDGSVYFEWDKPRRVRGGN